MKIWQMTDLENLYGCRSELSAWTWGIRPGILKEGLYDSSLNQALQKVPIFFHIGRRKIKHLQTLTRLSSHEMPYSFKADFILGQISCKYFSGHSNWNIKLETLNQINNPEAEILLLEKSKKKNQLGRFGFWWPLYWGKRVEKELTSSKPDSFQEGLNLSIFQWSMLGSSSHGFGLSCFPLCFFDFCTCKTSPSFSFSIAHV